MYTYIHRHVDTYINATGDTGSAEARGDGLVIADLLVANTIHV